MTKAKIVLPLLLVVSFAAGVGNLPHQVLTARPPEATQRAEPKVGAKEAGHAKPAKEEQPALTDRYGDPLPPGALVRLGSIRLRHTGPRVAFSADGKTVISFGNDQTVRHWDAASGREVRRIQLQKREDGTTSGIRALNGRTLVEWTGEDLVLWDPATGKHLREIRVGKVAINDLAVSPDGKRLAAVIGTQSDVLLRIWDATTGEECRRLDHPNFVMSLSFSPDGKRLGTVGMDDNLHLWEVATGKELRRIVGPRRGIAFSPDGEKVASADRQGVVKVWSVDAGRELAAFKKTEGSGVEPMAFSPDGKTLAAGGNLCEVFLLDVATGEVRRRIPARCFVAFSPDGKTMATWMICAIHLWDTATGREVTPRPGSDGPVGFLAVAPDGASLAAISPYDALIQLWDTASGKPLALLPGEQMYRFYRGAFSPDGKVFASGGMDGVVHLWNPATGQSLRQFSVELVNSEGVGKPETMALAFSPEGHELTIVSMAWHTRGGYRPKHQIDRWDLATGDRIARRLIPMEGWRACLGADGRTVVFRTRDALVARDVVTDQQWATLPENLREPFTLSPDGQVLAATIYKPKPLLPDMPPPADPRPEDAEAIVLTELATNKELLRIEMGAGGSALLAYSPDGRTLATADQDGFRLWNVGTGKELLRRELPEKRRSFGYSFASSLAFLPRRNALATGLRDGTVLIWDVATAVRRAGPAATDLDRKELERLWTDLAGDDAGKAHQAVRTLAAVPARAVPFLNDRLRPVAALDGKQVQRLIADLDRAEFARRDAAAKKLAEFGEQVEPLLRQALQGKPSLEMRKRLEALLEEAQLADRGMVRSSEVLRTLRAIRVLEQIGSPWARHVLDGLAAGDPAARPTRAAKEALGRLAKRPAPTP